MKSHVKVNEEVLRDARFPVSAIADKIIPYVRKLAETFRPQRIILFGSYAYGKPQFDSDVDLLVVKKITNNPIQEATAMRRALRPLRHAGNNISLDLMVRDPDDLDHRLASGATFHTEILQKGLLVYEN
jgi:predicted nucleotidyltransferase